MPAQLPWAEDHFAQTWLEVILQIWQRWKMLIKKKTKFQPATTPLALQIAIQGAMLSNHEVKASNDEAQLRRCSFALSQGLTQGSLQVCLTRCGSYAKQNVSNIIMC